MQSKRELIENAHLVEEKIGYRFHNRELIALAFTHRSFVNENKEEELEHNERLEFLGDSVLGMIVSDYLYRYLPTTREGDLSRLRSRLVDATACIAYIQKLDITNYLLLGKGEKLNDGRGRDTIHSDLFETIIGAIYLDGGLEAARKFFFKNFSHDIAEILKTPTQNWKANLQEYAQKEFHQPPVYHVLSEEGPDHGKIFNIAVHLNGVEMARGEGGSKKEAQQEAARNALIRIEKRE